MNTRRLRRWLPCSIALLACLPACAQQQQVKLQRKGQTIQVTIGNKPFTTYTFDPVFAKAFLQPVRDAHGIVVTRGFPVGNTVPPGHEHDPSIEPHQRDMYFGHGNMNGYDFWTEEAFAGFYGPTHPSNYGRMVFRKLEQMQSDGTTAIIRVLFDLEGTDHKPFAQETQQFTFHGTSDTRTIDCVIVVRALQQPVVFGDTKEGTFALRLAAPLDAPAGTMVNSEGGAGEPQIWGKQANWVNVDGTIDGQSLGVTIFDGPQSFHHPTYWHARGYGLLAANPFGLSFFSHDPHKDGSYTLPAGQAAEFRYRVLIHDGDYKQARVAEQYREYAGTK